MKLFSAVKESFSVEGIMPERALLRLKRAGIPVYDARKIEKTKLLFRVKRKDIEKVFAIYPKVCYNGSNQSPYEVTHLGSVGVGKGFDFLKNRAGVLLGALAFCALTLAADNLVLGVEFVGSKVYAREILQALEENGVKKYAFYPEGKEDIVTARTLSLSGVEFCSVRKVGHWVRVETHIDPFTTKRLQKESLTATYSGEIRSITVLRGTALKKVGDSVQAGESLVGNWFETEDGEQVRVEPIARVQIACVYEGFFEGASEEDAFAEAYLLLALSDGDEITEKKITKTEEGVFVEISYLVTQRVNF